MTKYANSKYFPGEYVLAKVRQWHGTIETYILLTHGVGNQNYWVVGRVLRLDSGKIEHSNGNIYRSNIVRKLTEQEVVVAKLRGLV